MADLSNDEQAEVTFISGVDQNGAVASNTYFTYNVEGYNFNPPRSYVQKWYNDANGSPIASTSTAGTPGGTVTYAFGPSVGAQAQAAYKATLTLWSDIANIQFKQVSDTSTASVLITNIEQSNGDTFVPANGYRVPGTGATDLPTQQAPNARGGQVAINVYSADDSNFNKLTPELSGLMSTLVHEEGHMIGLGHAGRYNGSAGYGDQIGIYDNAAYSVMSYFNPDDPNSSYYNQSPVQNSQWTTTTASGSFGGSAQTPMMLDILAAQRLYGASTSATFSGGQTYGFNCNIAGTSKAFYDFSTNQAPIVTIYNSGTNNTLDVSGFGSGCTINLNPGTFSSASASGQLIDNIGIAYGTRIDKAIGGAGDDYFTLNADNNTIDGGGGDNTVIIQGASADYTVVNTSATSAIITDNKTGAVDQLTNIQNIRFEAPVCFTTGTRIRVVRNGAEIDVPVEALRVSDVAVTAAGRLRPIVWIGSRRLDGEGGGRLDDARQPVRVRAGAFGDGLPARDLRLSPGHPVLVGASTEARGGVLVPIMCLINGTSIVREAVESVTYWHVELDAHDILLAEGLPAESYLDGGDRPFFVEASDHALHNPDFVSPGLSGRCRPVALDGPPVEAERRRIDALFALCLVGHCEWGADRFA